MIESLTTEECSAGIEIMLSYFGLTSSKRINHLEIEIPHFFFFPHTNKYNVKRKLPIQYPILCFPLY